MGTERDPTKHHTPRAAGGKALVLFIHGLGGDRLTTWGRFPSLLAGERGFSDRHHLGFFSYPTMLWRHLFSQKAPRIQELASGLRTQIENRYADFGSVALICHSLGGLVARQYLLEEVKAGRKLRVSHLCLIAVPNDGADLARVGSLLSWRHAQLKQLCRDSDLLQILNDDWATMGVEGKVQVRYVIGTNDRVVDRRSAQGYWGNRSVATILGADHRSIVKPTQADDDVVIVVRRFLQEQSPPDKDEVSAPSDEVAVSIEGPETAPLGMKTYYTIISRNAVRGEWGIGGFRNEPVVVEPLGPSHQIFVEPTDAARVGHVFTVAFTAIGAHGRQARATRQFVVTPEPDGTARRRPLDVLLADGIRVTVELQAEVQAIAHMAPMLVSTFGSHERAQRQVASFVEAVAARELARHTLQEVASGGRAIPDAILASAEAEVEQRFFHRLHAVIVKRVTPGRDAP